MIAGLNLLDAPQEILDLIFYTRRKGFQSCVNSERFKLNVVKCTNVYNLLVFTLKGN